MTRRDDDMAELQREFERWTRDELFDDRHREGTDVIERAVDIHLGELYRRLSMHELLGAGLDARALCEALGLVDSAWVALDAMLVRLAERTGHVAVSESGGIRTYRAISIPPDETDRLPALLERMRAMGDDWVAPMEFLAFGARHFERSLRDDPTFMDRVLTGQESEFAETWHRATNADPLQDVHGLMGGKAVDLLFGGGTILEVGGGTGNGLRNNLAALEASGRLDTLDRYVFTDVSMPFMIATRNELKARWPGVQREWRLLNINKSWEAQRVEPDSADLVYGVNAAHIAMRTVEFLEECKRVLRPGGRIVFAERVRRSDHDMAPREIVLNLSSYHRTAAVRHPEYRPTHAYLSNVHWLRACELAGFADCAVWPEPGLLQDVFPDAYASVVVART